MGKELGKSSPWVSYVHKLDALFGQDPDIRVELDEDDMQVLLYVHGEPKAAALRELLPEKEIFGNVELEICVVPDNVKISRAELIHTAFDGNPLFSHITTILPDGCSNPIHYVMFRKMVVQYWDDNLGHPAGLESTLAQYLAQGILQSGGGVMFCTDED